MDDLKLAVLIDADNISPKYVKVIMDEAASFGRYMTAQGAEQCGFCSPGLIMNIIGMTRELNNPTEDDIRNYLAGNLCRCSGYEGQLRGIRNYLDWKEGKTNG